MAADFAGSPYHSAQARQKQLSKGKNTATRLSKNSKKKKGQSVDKKQTKVIESDLEIDELRGALNEDGAEVMNPSAPESAPES